MTGHPDTGATPAMPLNIIHVFRAPVGGLFRHVVDLVRGQIARGHRVGIIADSTTGNARSDEIFAELAPQLALGLTRIRCAASSIRSMRPRSSMSRSASGRPARTSFTATAPRAAPMRGSPFPAAAWCAPIPRMAAACCSATTTGRAGCISRSSASCSRGPPCSCSRAPIAARFSARRSASRTASCASSITAWRGASSNP